MIKLSKGPKPQILAEKANQWTDEYLSCVNGNEKLNDTIAHRYNQAEIKEALNIETHGKCAYCESKIRHIEFGDIEHILPKKKECRPDLYVEWNNLTLACEICNRSNKKDYYSLDTPLVNPYVDDPEDFFLFIGTLISAKESNERGFVTESTLDLNRSDLVVRRNERLRSIDRLFYTWSQAPSASVKEVLLGELKKECAQDKEFSAFVKHFLISKGLPEEQLR